MMDRYNIVPDKDCPGNYLVMKTGTSFIACSQTSLAAALQAVRILEGSPETWTAGTFRDHVQAGTAFIS